MTEEGDQKIQGQKIPWYQSNAAVVISLLTIGPFALPLAWFNSRYSVKMKVGITLAVALFTYILGAATVVSLKMLKDTYQQLM